MTAADAVPVAPLVCQGLTLRFGGIHALDDVSLTVEQGEIVGLIGMNGAGKSTLLNCISGCTRPDSGSVTAFGVDITRAPPDRRSDLGIARTFQGGKLFPSMTVAENLALAFERQRLTTTFTAVLALPWGRRTEKWKEQEAERLLDLVGLNAYADKFVRELSTGTRRIVEIAALLAQRPRLILMDEPAAGIAQRETEALVPLLRQLRQELDCSIVIVEHDMPVIMSLCDQVYAMEAGGIIAQGPPAYVQAHPQVIASYLGEDRAAIERSDANGSVAPLAPDADTATRPSRGRSAQTAPTSAAGGHRIAVAASAADEPKAGRPGARVQLRRSAVLASAPVALFVFLNAVSVVGGRLSPPVQQLETVSAPPPPTASPTGSAVPVARPAAAAPRTTASAVPWRPPLVATLPPAMTPTPTPSSVRQPSTPTPTPSSKPDPTRDPIGFLCYVYDNGPVPIPRPVPCPSPGESTGAAPEPLPTRQPQGAFP